MKKAPWDLHETLMEFSVDLNFEAMGGNLMCIPGRDGIPLQKDEELEEFQAPTRKMGVYDHIKKTNGFLNAAHICARRLGLDDS